VTLPLPHAFQDREPLVLKLGPPIDFERRTFEELIENDREHLHAMQVSEEKEKLKAYDPWFTVEKPRTKYKRVRRPVSVQTVDPYSGTYYPTRLEDLDY
jgi:hypothetical protein